MIAEHLLVEYAAVKAWAMWPTPRLCNTPTTKISLAAKIWARYMTFEGVRYISSLANQPVDGDEEIFAPDPERHVDTFYVARNQLGIRHLLFGHSDQAPPLVRQHPWI